VRRFRNDKPVVDVASILGWGIQRFDGRAIMLQTNRFQKRHVSNDAKPEEILNK
jgi:hypothetical protein